MFEATCNQVNQDGGYTGMTPADFVRFVARDAIDLDEEPEAFALLRQGRRVMILRTFVKKTQKTPRREIELALKRPCQLVMPCVQALEANQMMNPWQRPAQCIITHVYPIQFC